MTRSWHCGSIERNEAAKVTMAEKRRGKQKRREGDESEKPTKEEYAVAKYLRFNVPVREGKLVGMDVQCFIASKAVDTMLESKWGPNKSKGEPLFSSRAHCVDFMDRLLQKGMFHRAARTEKKKKKKPSKEQIEESKKEEEKKAIKDKPGKKGKEKDTKEEEKEKDSEVEKEDKEKKDEKKKEKKDEKKDEKKEEEKKDEEKKKKRKLKLQMHDHQIFKDGDEVYVWIYDPVPLKTFVIGLLLVLGAIGVCLFPLWPPEVRLGVYYLSLAAAGFVGVILALCVIRLILFCIVWGLTFGKHHFWFLPNLTEDVGFFDSFKPLYHHEYCGGDKDKKDKKDKSNDKKEEEGKEDDKEKEEESKESKDGEKEGGEEEEEQESEKDSDNGYEIVDREELEEAEAEEEGEHPEEEEEEDDDQEKEDKKTK